MEMLIDSEYFSVLFGTMLSSFPCGYQIVTVKKPQCSARSKLTKVVTVVSENKSTSQLVNVTCDYLWVAF